MEHDPSINQQMQLNLGLYGKGETFAGQKGCVKNKLRCRLLSIFVMQKTVTTELKLNHFQNAQVHGLNRALGS